jgi:hypothetical protein
MKYSVPELTILASLTHSSEKKSTLAYELKKHFGIDYLRASRIVDVLFLDELLSYSPSRGVYEITQYGKDQLRLGLDSAHKMLDLLEKTISL